MFPSLHYYYYSVLLSRFRSEFRRDRPPLFFSLFSMKIVRSDYAIANARLDYYCVLSGNFSPKWIKFGNMKQVMQKSAQFLDCIEFLRSSTRLPFEHLNSDINSSIVNHKQIKSHRIISCMMYDIWTRITLWKTWFYHRIFIIFKLMILFISALRWEKTMYVTRNM